MMKKIICILCVLSTVFLFSCKREESVNESEKNNSAQTQSATDNLNISDTEISSTEKETTEKEKETETEVQKYQGGQNKFGLTNIRKNALSESQYEAYKVIINGMDEGRTEIPIDLTREANSYNRIKSAIWSSYPLYALVQEMHYYHNTKTLSIRYSKSGDELTNTIKAFYDKIDSIITKDLMVLDDTSKALQIYKFIAEKSTSDNNNLTVYDFIMNGKGTDIQFSMAYEYCLGLAGVECNHASSEIGEKQIALTQVKIGNNYYYMSPYHEAKKNDGKLLEFFGMNDDRAKITTGAKVFFSINNDYEKVSLPECNDTAFDFTKYLEKWSLDTDKKELTYMITDNIYTYKY